MKIDSSAIDVRVPVLCEILFNCANLIEGYALG